MMEDRMDQNSLSNLIASILRCESHDEVAESIHNYVHYRSEHISSDLLHMVWRNAKNGMLLTDADGKIVAVNSALCSMSAIREEDLIGQSFPVLFDDTVDRQQALETYYSNIRSKSFKPAEEKVVLFTSGQMCLVEIMTSVLVDEADELFVLQEFCDIAWRKEEAHALRRLSGQLDFLAEELMKLRNTRNVPDR